MGSLSVCLCLHESLLTPYVVPSIDADTLANLLADAYATFDAPDGAPLHLCALSREQTPAWLAASGSTCGPWPPCPAPWTVCLCGSFWSCPTAAWTPC